MADVSRAEVLSQPLGTVPRRILGFYLYALIIVLIWAIARVWAGVVATIPAAGPPAAGMVQTTEEIRARERAVADARTRRELSLFGAVVLLGALGGSVHAVTSFSTYLGNRNLVTSWIWWYVARAPIGGALALIIYLAIRGGLMGAGVGDTSGLNPYGLGALACLAGLSSEIATDKLREVFLALFRPAERKKDTLEEAAPILAAIEPDSIPHGATGRITLTITGEGFDVTDEVLVNGDKVETAFVTDRQIQATIPEGKLATPGILKVSIRRAGPKGVSSPAREIKVL